MKLEWGALRSRQVDQVRDLLWWDDGRLLGFLGIYGSGRTHLELAGMVDPDARRRGIGRALLEEVLPIVKAHGVARILAVVPRPSAAGKEFCRSYGMTYEHSEHALRLERVPAPRPASQSWLCARRPSRTCPSSRTCSVTDLAMTAMSTRLG